MEHDSDQHMFDLALKLLDDVDVRNVYGQTPLHTVGSEYAVRRLLEAQASVVAQARGAPVQQALPDWSVSGPRR
jgi:hypothetical protein